MLRVWDECLYFFRFFVSGEDPNGRVAVPTVTEIVANFPDIKRPKVVSVSRDALYAFYFHIHKLDEACLLICCVYIFLLLLTLILNCIYIYIFQLEADFARVLPAVHLGKLDEVLARDGWAFRSYFQTGTNPNFQSKTAAPAFLHADKVSVCVRICGVVGLGLHVICSLSMIYFASKCRMGSFRCIGLQYSFSCAWICQKKKKWSGRPFCVSV